MARAHFSRCPPRQTDIGRIARHALVLAAVPTLMSCDSDGRPPSTPAVEVETVEAETVEVEVVEVDAAEQEADSAPATPPSPWRSLRDDGIHDPTLPALALLQEPADALSVLPPAQEGNLVDWVAALHQGAIEPRTNVYPETKVQVLDLDIRFEETGGMPIVLFPHRQHTEWLDCSNCHDQIFVARRGANDISMLDILDGRYCGQCHGAVSFPLTQCQRCHSVPRDDS